MKIIVGRDLLLANSDQAVVNRKLFRQSKVVAINLISSPGSGKTTLMEKTAVMLADRLKIGVVVGDLYTERDAARIEKAGAAAVQINTEGLCHLTADMVYRALLEMPLAELDVLFIENVGNLVCPAAFDLGEQMKIAVLSVTEGIDKPSKYPSVFREAGVAVINKEDLLPYTDFDLDTCLAELKEINDQLKIFITSARSGHGLDEWCSWLESLAGAQ
ncbi:hydrogenase nickel incorporation protein HypB [Desulfotomaculum arcticum]|uniref:Hydrogenase nickel incorporation protein HypB n=1 Tax=Desulfotruncus arcticus DSM 17038 TaxID=1121424 RepID=A0A1I2TYF8_9FIRM|nr:hydrogenase nickel incorporation protein HypB [Desulfotruncus arcticus]SFG69209.1 hydrogenase nickel incorporation protein HypB [Desulfotomaculum arcticum] [Desulfotruncus arcticus DSM 17038]